MKKIVLAPDSFKGTMSSTRICAIMRDRLRAHFPACEIIAIPIADGGEGTVDSFLEAAGGEKISCRAHGPFMEEMDSFYGILPNGAAVIEMAAAAGLPLVEGRANPAAASAFGVGELMLDAVRRGCKKLIIGLGGSCTNDLGAGAAAAAGARFLDRGGAAFTPVGGTLSKIADIDLSGLHAAFSGVEIIAMCDIDNPLFGEAGAAHIFAPQKGADAAMVSQLDEGLRHAAAIIEAKLNRPIADKPGAGAAGGMGAGMDAFFNAALKPGIDAVLDAADFDTKMENADFIFTGEGRIDAQSLRGKVVIGVSRRVRARAPVIAFVGAIEDPICDAYAQGVSAIFTINRRAVDFQQARLRCEEDLALTIDNFAHFAKRMAGSW